MKTTTGASFVHLKEAELRKLMTQVKEEVATDVILSSTVLKNKKFGVVDLWKCRRVSRINNIVIR